MSERNPPSANESAAIDRMATDQRESEDWWRTSIIEMSPGVIRYRGYPIEELISQRVSLAQMIWLMTRGELPSKAQGALLEVALMSAVDHGPQAPSIAIARMAATCGVGLNSAMASAVNVLGDVHGGAGEQAVELYQSIAARIDAGAAATRADADAAATRADADAAATGIDADAALADAVRDAIEAYVAVNGKVIPGFGHRFHPVDPRSAPLLALVDEAAAQGEVSGRFAAIGRAVEAHLAATKGRSIPMNIDGATAVIYAELGFAAPLARGLFCLSRSVGILAHAWEQTEQGGRIKGPLPRRYTWTYEGPDQRSVPARE